jgi:aminomethyltransferase
VAAVKEKIHTGSQAHDYEEDILAGSEVVGQVTFSAKGHTVDKMLAMPYVKSFHAWPGGRLVVTVKGRPRVATVTPTPFFDPQGMRLKA